MPIFQLVRHAQINQAAQAGYAADYQNKRLPIAMNEIKEWQKAQVSLVDDIMDKKPGYVGARLAKRLMTDCYGRGVCRGAVESTNLILHAAQKDPTAAETIKTAQVADIALAYPLRLLTKVAAEQPWPMEPRRKQTDTRVHSRPKLTDCPFWTIYGGRGQRSEATGLLEGIDL